MKTLRIGETPVPTWFTRYSFLAPQMFILRSRISPRSDFTHRRWISSGGEVFPRRQDIIAWADKPTPGRGFEEVHERERHKPKSVLQYGCAKTPLRRTKKGSTLFALPSEGSNPFCLGSFGGARGDFFKSPLESTAPPQKPRAPQIDMNIPRVVRRKHEQNAHDFLLSQGEVP